MCKYLRKRETGMPYRGVLLFSPLSMKRTVLPTDWSKIIGEVLFDYVHTRTECTNNSARQTLVSGQVASLHVLRKSCRVS